MEQVSIKFEKSLSAEIGKAMKEFHYTTKTEFIREAIRKMLKELEEEKNKKHNMALLERYFGSAKGKSVSGSYEEWDKWRHNEGSEIMKRQAEKRFGIKLD